MTATIIANIPAEAILCTDSQDCDAIRENVGPDAAEYDSFFVIIGDGDYSAVWGFCGYVPYNSKLTILLGAVRP